MTNAETAMKNEEIFAIDRFIANVQVVMNTLMVERGMSRADLAAKLGVSEARVSQMFKDEPKNFTAKTIARVFFALGEDPEIHCAGLEEIRQKRNQPSKREETKAVSSWRHTSRKDASSWSPKNGMNDNAEEKDYALEAA